MLDVPLQLESFKAKPSMKKNFLMFGKQRLYVEVQNISPHYLKVEMSVLINPSSAALTESWTKQTCFISLQFLILYPLGQTKNFKLGWLILLKLCILKILV